MGTDPFLRPAVRGLVVTDAGEILMTRLVYPHGSYWVLPGGGIEPDEDEFAALARELNEEVGLANPEIGAIVWHRSHVFDIGAIAPDGRRYEGQRETVFEVRTQRFDPSPMLTPDQLRAENLHECRWWSVAEIESYTGTDFFAPPDIARLVRDHLSDGPPREPRIIVQE